MLHRRELHLWDDNSDQIPKAKQVIGHMVESAIVALLNSAF